MRKIEHLVILMMENRSFDHYLGSLSLLEGRTDVEGLQAGMSNPAPDNGPPVQINNLDGQYDGYPDPPHGWGDQHENWNDGAMSGFVQNYVAPLSPEDTVKYMHVPMGYYTRATLPVLYKLADHFTICDHWFSSCLSSTWPNRKYFLSGKRDSDDDTQTLPPFPGFETTPFFDVLEDHVNPDNGQKCTWKCYFTDLPFLGFWYKFAATHAFHNFRTVLDFAIDCRENTLPTVSVIDPAFGLADDHPSYDVRRGQKFLGLIIDALTHSESWHKTALVLMYDENGAFFDHVAPPSSFTPGGPQPDGDLPFGFRTPTVVVSPYSGRKVVKTVFDHTSIMQSIHKRWGVNFDTSVFGNRWTMAPDIWSHCFDFNAAPMDIGNYAESESLKDLSWEKGIHDVITRPPGGVLSNLERLFILPSHAKLDNRSKMFDLLNNLEREVVSLKRLV